MKDFFYLMLPIKYNLIVIIIGMSISTFLIYKYYKTKARLLLNAIPGVWTSLGILFTFISICMTLSGVVEGASTDIIDNTGKTVAEASKATNNIDIIVIIKGLIPAFSTSIYGLIFALVATVLLKYEFAKEDYLIDLKVEKKSPEEYLYAMSENSKVMIEQTLYIKDILINQEEKNHFYNERLNTNISAQSKILEKFINNFVDRMDSIFKQMHGAIEQQIKDFGEEQFKKSSTVLQDITKQMTDVSSGLLEQQKETVKNIMNSTSHELQTITAKITELVSTLAENTTTGLSTIENKQQEKLDNIVSHQLEFTNTIIQQNKEFVSEANKSFAEEYSKVQEHNVQSLQQMSDLKSAYEELSGRILNESTHANAAIVNDLRTNINDFVIELQNTISSQCNTLSNAIKNNVTTLKESYSFIDEHISQIKSDYEQSTLAYRDAVQNAHDINDSFEKTITHVDYSLKSVVKTNQNIDKVMKVIEDKQTNIEILVIKIQEMNNAVETLQKLESTLYKLSNK